MREFILRARKGPTTPDFDLQNLKRAGRLEVVAHCVANALFYASNLRENTVLHVVLEGPAEPPKTLSFASATLGSLQGFDERSIAVAIQSALKAGVGLALRQERISAEGVTVSKLGFEHLIQDRQGKDLYYLNRKGRDIRDARFGDEATFVFSDYLSMPKKSDKYLARLGAEPISLGPRLLFASHCIVLVHNELDRQGIP